MLKEYKNRIRPIAISIIRNNDKMLVYEREDGKIRSLLTFNCNVAETS